MGATLSAGAGGLPSVSSSAIAANGRIRRMNARTVKNRLRKEKDTKRPFLVQENPRHPTGKLGRVKGLMAQHKKGRPDAHTFD